MSLQTETTHETTTFDHFGRSWTVPTRRHLSHLKKMRDELRRGTDPNVMICEVFLPSKEFDELLKIDPTDDQLEEFTDLISAELGLKESGNS